jgi:hypothetical protein
VKFLGGLLHVGCYKTGEKNALENDFLNLTRQVTGLVFQRLKVAKRALFFEWVSIYT